ncbi:hypothetical protein [Nocardia sp. NPDC005366]|uniref:hypothetical protein n=1 Tax=Nocardia sp. NPDC005366 TaxID=3156878 RepID=UPI0033B10280
MTNLYTADPSAAIPNALPHSMSQAEAILWQTILANVNECAITFIDDTWTQRVPDNFPSARGT